MCDDDGMNGWNDCACVDCSIFVVTSIRFYGQYRMDHFSMVPTSALMMDGLLNANVCQVSFDLFDYFVLCVCECVFLNI